MVDQEEINKILINIEKTKYGENYATGDKQGKISMSELRKRIG